MEFQKIQLTLEQIEELYSSHLVIADQPTSTSKEKEIIKKDHLSFKGKNKKHFVWIVDVPEFSFLDDADFQFTADVINACKMNMDDVALVNIAGNSTNFSELAAQLQPKYLIFSATNLQWLPVSTGLYQIHELDEIQLYITESITDLRNDKVKKSKLWLALKQMLGL